MPGTTAIVFDLDGTLIDSVPDLSRALNKLLKAQGRRRVSDLETASFVGNGALKLTERAFRATGEPANPAELPQLTKTFLGYYDGHECDLTTLYPGVRDTLDTLLERKIAMAVCTNKPHAPTLNILREFDLEKYFPAVIGGDVLERKPDPASLNWCLEELGVRPDAALMVGDTINDIGAAQNAGVPSIAVSFGYSQGKHGEFGADHVIDAFPDLLGLLDKTSA